MPLTSPRFRPNRPPKGELTGLSALVSLVTTESSYKDAEHGYLDIFPANYGEFRRVLSKTIIKVIPAKITLKSAEGARQLTNKDYSTKISKKSAKNTFTPSYLVKRPL